MCDTICEIFELIISNLSTVIAIMALLVSIIQFVRTQNKERKIETIKEWIKIRDKYHDELELADYNRRNDFLTEMEFFCTGINTKIFDFKILKRLSGTVLANQYAEYMEKYVEEQRKISGISSNAWNEYKMVMDRLCRELKISRGVENEKNI